MSTRYTAFLVTLEHPTRDDDAEPTLNALRNIRGVARVKPVEQDPLAEQVAETRVRTELGKAMFAILFPEKAK